MRVAFKFRIYDDDKIIVSAFQM